MIHVGINYTQTRLTRSVMVVEGDAERWDRLLSTNCMITDDGMAMARPLQKTDYWYTTTGATNLAYKRFGTADLEIEAGTTLAVAGGYRNNDIGLVGNTFVENLGGTNVRVYTATDWAINQGFWVEMWVPVAKGSERVALDFAWGEAGATGSVGVRIYVGGEIEVYKWFDVGGTPTQKMVGRYDGGGEGRSARINNVAGQIFSVMLLPCARRDLYIATSNGATVRHTFEDLSPDVVNTITPAGRAWYYIPTGKFSVSLSNLRYTVGAHNLYTQIDYLREAPSGTASWATTLYWDRPSAADTSTSAVGLVVQSSAPTTIYPATGGADNARILVQLVSTLTHTPFVYAAYSRLAPVTTNLTASPTVLSGNSSGGSIDTTNDRLKAFDLTIGEQPDGVKGTLSLKDATDEIRFRQSGHSLRLMASQGISVASFSDWRNIACGVTLAPKRSEAVREVQGILPITMPFSDMWELLDAAIFEENSYPYDGWLLHQAVGDLLTLAGIPSSPRDIQTSTLRLDYVRPTTDTKWAWKPQAGDSIGMWLKKIWETFAPNWFMGFYPTSTTSPSGSADSVVGSWGFQFRSPSSMSTTPRATIYLASQGDALTPYTPSGSERIPCFSYVEDILPAEATRITIWGYDPSSKTLLRGSWADATLETPTTAPASRPAGWVGYVSPYVAVLPRLRTAASVAAARDAMEETLGQEKRLAEWESPLLFRSDTGVMIYKGDVVEIRPATSTLPGGNPVGGIYRVLSLSLSWKRDAIGLRKVSYTGERIGNIT